ENFRPAAGNGIQASVHQAHDGVAESEAGNLRDIQNLRRGKAVQVNLREAPLDVAEQVFVVVDLEVRMQPTLHQHACAAQGNRLLDFLIDGFEGLDIAFRRAHGAIEGAEGAVFGADV